MRIRSLATRYRPQTSLSGFHGHLSSNDIAHQLPTSAMLGIPPQLGCANRHYISRYTACYSARENNLPKLGPRLVTPPAEAAGAFAFLVVALTLLVGTGESALPLHVVCSPTASYDLFF